MQFLLEKHAFTVHAHGVHGFHVAHLRRVAHSFHENKTGEDHADLDGNDQVEGHRQDESGQQHQDVHAVAFEDTAKLLPFGHVPGHDDEDAGECGHRDQLGVRREDQHDEEQDQGVYHAGDGCPPARLDVGRRARNGPCRGDAAKEPRENVGRALCDEFGVGAVPPADHPVGDNGGEQRFDGAEQGNGNGRLDKRFEFRERHHWDGRGTDSRGNLAKTALDGLHGQPQELHNQRRQKDGGDRARYFLADLVKIQTDDNGADTDQDSRQAGTADMRGKGGPFFKKISRHLPHIQPEKVFDLG